MAVATLRSDRRSPLPKPREPGRSAHDKEKRDVGVTILCPPRSAREKEEMEKWSFQRIRELMTQIALRGMAGNELGRARISMMVRSMSSNTRPDTLVQDQRLQPHDFSCNARRVHTLGQNLKLPHCDSNAWFTSISGHKTADSSGETAPGPILAVIGQLVSGAPRTRHSACYKRRDRVAAEPCAVEQTGCRDQARPQAALIDNNSTSRSRSPGRHQGAFQARPYPDIGQAGKTSPRGQDGHRFEV